MASFRSSMVSVTLHYVGELTKAVFTAKTDFIDGSLLLEVIENTKVPEDSGLRGSPLRFQSLTDSSLIFIISKTIL